MTITEAHELFKVELDKNANGIGISGCPSFLSEEIDHWLYSAYLTTISTKFTGNNTIQAAFEQNLKRLTDLEMLVKTDKNINLLSEANTNKLIMHDFISSTVIGDQPQDKRMFFISGILHFNDKQAIVQPVSHAQARNFTETYTNKPWIENPVVVLENNSLNIYIDRDVMEGPFSLDLTYLAYPNRINHLDITSGMDQIPEYVQYEVIKLAALMAIENIESPRVQTNPQLFNGRE